MNIQLRGKGEQLALLPGYQTWIAGINAHGWNQAEIPNAIHLPTLLKNWARVFLGDKSEFRGELMRLQPHWVAAVDSTGNWHKQIVERRIAALEARRKRQADRVRRWQQETQAILKQFKKKNYLD